MPLEDTATCRGPPLFKINLSANGCTDGQPGFSRSVAPASQRLKPVVNG
ncbi:hypothetical protein T261_0533 [Streptomyces lydicus]|nr:hypothetical protein T261_0533 [Streptomyces lydicus]